MIVTIMVSIVIYILWQIIDFYFRLSPLGIHSQEDVVLMEEKTVDYMDDRNRTREIAIVVLENCRLVPQSKKPSAVSYRQVDAQKPI